MRALWLPDLKEQEAYIIAGDAHHHLVHVVRVQLNEEVLLLNGNGLEVLAVIQTISKKEVGLKFLKSKTHSRKYEMSLVLGMPKKEALELSLKEAVELGFKQIFLVKSDYSQTRFLEKERLQSILISALEQSNASFLPEVISTDWEKIPWNKFVSVLLLDSQSNTRKSQSISSSTLLVVGPEGGFSPQELQFLHKLPNVIPLTLPTPILRTPTAVAVGAGIILERLLD